MRKAIEVSFIPLIMAVMVVPKLVFADLLLFESINKVESNSPSGVVIRGVVKKAWSTFEKDNFTESSTTYGYSTNKNAHVMLEGVPDNIQERCFKLGLLAMTSQSLKFAMSGDIRIADFNDKWGTTLNGNIFKVNYDPVNSKFFWCHVVNAQGQSLPEDDPVKK